MKTIARTLAVTLGAVLSLGLVNHASAQCGALRPLKIAPASWQPLLQQAGPRLLRTSLLTVSESDWRHEEEQAAITGLWHVKFVTKDSPGIPDDTEVDAGYAQWHSDGTEIMNSGSHSPITSAFCLGVWKKVGHDQYKLNHFAIAWDATESALVGPVNIREDVTLQPGHDHFAGKFTIDVYDESGNSLAHLQGDITGTRIDVDTAVSPIF